MCGPHRQVLHEYVRLRPCKANCYKQIELHLHLSALPHPSTQTLHVILNKGLIKDKLRLLPLNLGTNVSVTS